MTYKTDKVFGTIRKKIFHEMCMMERNVQKEIDKRFGRISLIVEFMYDTIGDHYYTKRERKMMKEVSHDIR